VSSKYEFHHAREWALKYLRLTWSRTSPTWLDYLSNPTSELARDALNLLEAARSTRSPEFVPVVFCFLCMFDDLRGVTSGNTTLSYDDILKLWLGSRCLLKSWGAWCYKKAEYQGTASGWGSVREVPAHKWNEFVRSTETVGSVITAMGFVPTVEARGARRGVYG